MEEIKIEHDVPIPERVRKKYQPKYPFIEMKKGDSFSLPGKDLKELKSLQSKLSGSAYFFRIKTKPSWKFTARVLKEEKQVRIWRIK